MYAVNNIFQNFKSTVVLVRRGQNWDISNTYTQPLPHSFRSFLLRMCFLYGRAYAVSRSLLTAVKDVEKLPRSYLSRNYVCGRLLQYGAIARRFFRRVLALLYTIPNVVLASTHPLFFSCFSACSICRVHPRPESSYSAHLPSPSLPRTVCGHVYLPQSYVGIGGRPRPQVSSSFRFALVALVCAAPATSGGSARL